MRELSFETRGATLSLSCVIPEMNKKTSIPGKEDTLSDPTQPFENTLDSFPLSTLTCTFPAPHDTCNCSSRLPPVSVVSLQQFSHPKSSINSPLSTLHTPHLYSKILSSSSLLVPLISLHFRPLKHFDKLRDLGARERGLSGEKKGRFDL